MGIKILVASDNLDNAEKLRNVLKFAVQDADIYTAATNKDALAFADSGSIQLMLLDFDTFLSGQSEFCLKIKSAKSLSGIPVILLLPRSASPEIHTAMSASGINAVLRKPSGDEEIINQVKALLNEPDETKTQGLTIKKHKKSREKTAGKKAVEKIASSDQEELRDFLMTNMDGYWSINENYYIINANDAACKILGYSREEILRKQVHDIEVLESRAETLEHLRKIREQGAERFETQLLCKNGKVITAELSVAWREKLRSFLVLMRDISLNKLTEFALIESEERFRSLYENVSIGIFRTTPEGKFLMANPALIRMIGVSSFEDLVNLNVETLYEGLSLTRSEFKQRVETEDEIIGLEMKWKRPDREVIYIRENAKAFKDEKGNILYYEGTVEDITSEQITKIEVERKTELLNAILENSPVGFAIVRNSTGIVEYIGNQFEELYGLPKNTIKTVEEFFNSLYPDEEERKNKRAKIAADIQNGGTGRMEWHNIPIKSPDGGIKYVSALHRPIDSQGITLSVVRDVTEQYVNEQALALSENALREAQRIAALGSWENNLVTNELKWSHEMYRILGFPPGSKISMRQFESIFPYDDLKRYGAAVSAAVFYDLPYSEDYKIIRPDKQVRFIHDEGEVIRDSLGKAISLRGTTQDITERKTVENIVAESEMKFRLIWESSRDGMRLTNLQGIVVLVNSAYCRLVGYDRDSLIGRPFADIYETKTAEELTEFFFKRVLMDNHQQYYEKETFMKNGFRKWLAVSISKVNLEEQDSLVLSIFRDISDQKLTEKILTQYKNELEMLVESRTRELRSANLRLEEEIKKKSEYEIILKDALAKEKEAGLLKNKFISNTSHEFRTPLTAILSSVELIQKFDQKWATDKKEHHFQKIISSIDHLISLLDEVLTLSKVDSGKTVFSPKKIVLNKTIENIMHEVDSYKNPNYIFIPEIKLQKQFYCIDEKLVRTILSNLLSNAFKYSPDGGTIKLIVSDRESGLEFVVSDEGIGIPETDQKFLFEPFFRSSNSMEIQGSGLGLSIVEKAVAMHGGIIKFKSEPGKGSVFTVFISQGDKL